MTTDYEKVVRYRLVFECSMDDSGGHMDARKDGEWVEYSAYAELEKHSERIEVAYLASESRAEDAESQAADLSAQLAELRGSMELLAAGYAAEAERHLMHAANKEWAEWVRADHSSRASELNGAAREIRTLAAADGATTGKTK